MHFRGRSFFIITFLFAGVSLNAYANPQGESVVSGSATFDRSTPNTLTINTASNKTIINYNSFSIAANETTRINQPSAGSAVLNRVVGVNPSAIYGTLSSNGKIFLVNPNGIIFGPGSQVNAPAILASTLDINNDDFLNGNYNFFKNGGSSYIINQGRLAASPGGYIALLSQAVNNQGVIIADLGSVALAAGEKMTLALDSQAQISVVIDQAVQSEVLGPDGRQIHSAIQNSGTIQANGGKVLLTAKVLNDVFDYAVNNSGVIEATALQNNNGVVELTASGAPIINSGTINATQVNISDSDSNFINTGEIQSNQINISVPDSTFINQGQVISQLTAGLLDSGNIFLQALDIQQDGLISADNIIDLTADNVSTTVPFQNTTPSPVIEANQVNITANNLGAPGLPVAVDASNITFDRASGDIDITGSQPIGSNVMITGPPAPGGFGSIIYNPGTNLTLDASSGSIYVAPQAAVSANNLTLTSDNSIVNDGSLLAGQTLNLITNGYDTNNGLIQAPIINENSYHFSTIGSISGVVNITDIDGASTIGGSISGTINDNGGSPGITVTSNVTLTGNTTLNATNGAFNAAGFSIDSQSSHNFDLTINVDAASTLGPMGQTQPLGNLKLTSSSGSQTFTMGGAVTIIGVLTIGNNTTLDASASNYGLTVGGNWVDNGTFTPRADIVTFDGTNNQSITGASSQTFNNVVLNLKTGKTLDASGITTLTTNNLTETNGNFKAPATLNIDGSLTLTAGTFTAGANTNIAGDWTNNGGTFTSGSGTVTFNGSGAQAINGTATTQTFNNLTTSGSALSIGGSTTTLNINGGLTIGANTSFNNTVNTTLTANSSNLTVNGTLNVNGNITMPNKGNVIVNSGGSIVFDSTHVITGGGTNGNGASLTINSGANLTTANTAGFGGFTSNNAALTGSFTINPGNQSSNVAFSPGANYTFDGTSAQITGSGITGANNLTINNPAGVTLSSGMTVAGNLTIDSGATLDVSASNNYALTLGGNWSNSGTFDARSGTVTFNGSSAQTIKTNGDSFNNVTLSNNAINLPSSGGDLTIGGTLLTTSAIKSTINTNNQNFTVDGLTEGTSTSYNQYQTLTIEAGTGNITFYGVHGMGGGQDSSALTGLTINSAHNVDFYDATSFSFPNNSAIAITGGLTQSAGTGTTTFHGPVSTGAETDITTGTIAFVGTGSISANYPSLANVALDALINIGTGTVTLTGSTITNNGTINISTGTLKINGNFNNAGTLDSTGAANINVSGTLTNNGTLKLLGSETLPIGAFTDNGTTDYYGSGTYTITPLGTYNNLQFDNGTFVLGGGLTSASLTNSATLDLNGQSLTVAGSFSNAGTVYNSDTIDRSTIYLGEDFTNSGTMYPYNGTTHGYLDLYFNASDGNTHTIDAGGSNFDNVEFNDNGTGTTWQLINNPLNVNGNLTIDSGTITQEADLTIGGDYAQSGGTFTSDHLHTFSVGGSFSIPYYGNGTFTRYTGSGTSGDPYLIYDVYGLQGMEGFLNNISIYFKLANDIDATVTEPTSFTGGHNWISGTGFVPVGDNNNSDNNNFTGTFDGNEHTISNLYINQPSGSSYIGLFGYSSGTIENVGLTNESVTAGDGSSFVGGLVGFNTSGEINHGTIENVGLTGGSVSAGINSRYVGGLVGFNDNNNLNLISGSYTTGSVTVGANGYEVGGLVGENDGSITGSHATGNVTVGDFNYPSGSAYVGGLVGYNSTSGTIDTSYATGNINVEDYSSYVGGLVGDNDNTISNSYATGSVTVAVGDNGNGYEVGGLVGENDGSISGSYATGNVTAGESSQYVGGLVGANFASYNGTIDTSYATGDVTAGANSYEVGGLVGENDGSITGSYATGSVTAGANSYEVGGLVGYNLNGTVDTSYATGSVVAGDNSGYVGGLVGDNDNTISNSYATGSVTVAVGDNGNGYEVGGLVGENDGSISGSYATGSVVAGDNSGYIGGLVGANFASYTGTIDTSYATGDVTAGTNSYEVGGLVGENDYTISNSYATGNVTLTAGEFSQYVGGLVGYNTFGTITDSYATGNVTGNIAVTNGDNNYTTNYVGGLVGFNDFFSSITNSYATGSVTGNITVTGGGSNYSNNEVGGLIGENDGTSTNSYSTGSVTGNISVTGGGTNNANNYVGGLVGYNNGGTITNNAWWTGAATNAVGYDSNLGTPIATLSSQGWGTDDGAISDFYSPVNSVYDIGGDNPWDIFTPTWDFYTDELPHLDFEHHSGNIYSVWSGTTSTDWSTGSNWVGGNVPGASANIFISARANDPVISSDLNVSTILIGSGATLDGDHSLNVTGNAVLNGTVGSISPLASLYVGGTTDINGGSVSTVGTQQYNGDVTLGSNTTLTGNSVTFDSSLDGGYALTINDPGTTTFSGAVGSVTPLTSLDVNAATIDINGGAVSTTGSQEYNGAVVLGADTTLTGNTITFESTLDSNTGSEGLEIFDSGTTTFNGKVGVANNPLSYLTIDSTGGSTTINTDQIITNGSQDYGNAVTLGNNVTLNGTTVTFDSTLAGDFNLDIEADAVFNGAVGSGTPLESLYVKGTSDINGGSVSTDTTQEYNGDVTLSADTTLTGSTITFDSLLDGGHALTINDPGTTTFSGAVGSLTPLTSLDVAATAIDINGGSVSTTGTQEYNGSVTLGTDTTLTASTVTIDSSATFDPNGHTVTGSGILDVFGTLLVDASTFGGNYAFSTTTLESGSTVNYAGVGDQTIDSALSPYYNLITSGSGNKTLDGATTVSGDLTIGSSTVFNLNGYTLTVDGSLSNNGTLVFGVTGITAANKTFDGTTTATLNTANAALVGGVVVDGNAVVLNTAGAIGAFSSQAVGTHTVTVTGLTLSGPAINDYGLALPLIFATITPAAATAGGGGGGANINQQLANGVIPPPAGNLWDQFFNAYNPPAPGVYFYHPLTDIDSSSIDSSFLDLSDEAFEFIDGRLNIVGP